MSPPECCGASQLLVMFDEVYRGRSISQVAERLGVSQPSVSLGIDGLREHFGDRVSSS